MLHRYNLCLQEKQNVGNILFGNVEVGIFFLHFSNKIGYGSVVADTNIPFSDTTVTGQ